MANEKWPQFERQRVGNCAFCWAAEWSEKHEPACAKRQKAYLASFEKNDRKKQRKHR